MININSVKINPLSNKILVDVSGKDLSKVLFWTHVDFKNYTKSIDVSSLIPEPEALRYIFEIPLDIVNRTDFDGLFFLEFTFDELDSFDECYDPSNTRIAIAANLVKYYECLLNSVMTVEIDKCGFNKPICPECSSDIYATNVLLETLTATIKFGFFEESVKIAKQLDDICEICSTCPSNNNRLVNGFGFGTFDNSIILV